MVSKIYRQFLSVLLSLSMLSVGVPAHAVKLPNHLITFGMDTNDVPAYSPKFTDDDPRLKDHMWITAIFPEVKVSKKSLTQLIQQNNDSPGYLSQRLYWGTEEMMMSCGYLHDLNTGDPRAAEIDHREEAEELRQAKQEAGWTKWEFDSCDNLKWRELVAVGVAQKQLNLIMQHGAGLRDLLDADQFDEAWSYAKQHALVRLITQSAGFSILGAKAFDASRMLSFYASANRNWTIVTSEGQPYTPYLWGDPRGHANAARANSQHAEMGQLPNIAYFIKKEPKKNFGDYLRTAIIGIVVSVVTAGIGSAISGAITSSVGQGVTVAANGTITSGTIGDVSIAQGTIGGAALSVGSNAVAGAIVGTAQGQSFGDALVSGLIGGATGAVVGNVASNVGVGDAVNSVIQNDTVASYVTGVTIGTATGAILNGGDLDAAFTGAASGTATSMIAAGLTNANNGNVDQETANAFAEQMAQLQNGINADAANSINNSVMGDYYNNGNHSNMMNSLNNSIVNGVATAQGALDFNMAQQANADWAVLVSNQLASAQNAGSQMDAYLGNIADNQAAFDAATDGYEPLSAGTFGGWSNTDGFDMGSSGASYAGAAFTGGRVPLVFSEATLIALGIDPNETFDPVKLGFHGSNRGDLDSIMTPNSLGGSNTFAGVFDDALNNPQALLDRGFDQELIDRIRFEANRVGFFEDVENARLYAKGPDGRVYVIDVTDSHVLDASSRPSSNWITEGRTADQERFATGNHRVVGTVNPDGSISFTDPDVEARFNAMNRSTLLNGRNLLRAGSGLAGAALTAWDVLPMLPGAADWAEGQLPGTISDYQDTVNMMLNEDTPWYLQVGLADLASSQANLIGSLSAIETIGHSDTVAAGNEIRSDIVEGFYGSDATIWVGDNILGPAVDAIGDAATSIVEANAEATTQMIESGYMPVPGVGIIPIARTPSSTNTQSSTESSSSTTSSSDSNKSVVTTTEAVSQYIAPVTYVPPSSPAVAPATTGFYSGSYGGGGGLRSFMSSRISNR